MRILAIDHGTRRMGIAVSDELRTIAQPLEFIPAEPFESFIQRFKVILQEKVVGLIVIGMPRNMDGSYGPATEKVRDFIERLKPEIKIPIRTWDERLTSVQANRYLIQLGSRRDKRREKVDQTAAAILLQSFLDSGAAAGPGTS
jgi:putative Holliday junction resolvase